MTKPNIPITTNPLTIIVSMLWTVLFCSVETVISHFSCIYLLDRVYCFLKHKLLIILIINKQVEHLFELPWINQALSLKVNLF